MFKDGGLIAVGQGTSTAWTTQFNSNFYPIGNPTLGDYNFNGYFPMQYYGTTMVVRWSGQGGGQINTFGYTYTVVSGGDPGGCVVGGIGTYTDRLTVSGLNCRVQFSMSPTSPAVSKPTSWAFFFTEAFGQITYGSGTTQMSNLAMYRLSDEAAWTTSPYGFTPEYISFMKTLNPKILRIMDWSGVTNGNVTSNKYAMSLDSVAYNSQIYPIPRIPSNDLM
jgi:hypothetical protein